LIAPDAIAPSGGQLEYLSDVGGLADRLPAIVLPWRDALASIRRGTGFSTAGDGGAESYYRPTFFYRDQEVVRSYREKWPQKPAFLRGATKMNRHFHFFLSDPKLGCQLAAGPF
jgi:hypothetical protein